MQVERTLKASIAAVVSGLGIDDIIDGGDAARGKLEVVGFIPVSSLREHDVIASVVSARGTCAARLVIVL